MKNIFLVKGDITKAETDAIVNAANSAMLGGGGVDGAIHRAAGKSLLEACREVKEINGVRCPAGQARITHAGSLKAKHVIHAVGPRFRYDASPNILLASAYRNSLQLAKQNACKSIALPAISCGVYAYPLDEAAEIAIKVCREDEFKDMEIYFYLFMDDVYQAWENALNA